MKHKPRRSPKTAPRFLLGLAVGKTGIPLDKTLKPCYYGRRSAIGRKEGVNMSKKIRWITETALMLALLVVLQAATRPLNNQFVTGTCVNAVLVLTAMLVGLGSGLTVALISPVLAFLLGIAPQAVVVPAIMAGNAVYVALVRGITQGTCDRVGTMAAGWLLASLAKFATLYLLVAKVICGLISGPLLASGALKEAMLKALPVMFAWPQLFTALAGGAAALLMTPVLKKALKR